MGTGPTLRFETLAVHAGGAPDPETGALAPPLHLATTFRHSPDGVHEGEWLYQRHDNPTQQRLESALATLDHGARALFFSSGLAACAAALHMRPGGRLVVQEDCYSGFLAQLRHQAPRWGWQVELVDLVDPKVAREVLSTPADLVWIETPSNPLLRIADIAQLAALAHAAGAPLLVDGTFASPALQSPLSLGADVVLHSATKYMGGHSDALGGALVFAADGAMAQNAFHARELVGLSASPFNAWLVLRGLRSLSARMAAHCRGAAAVAAFLAGHPAVDTVNYPGLPDSPFHALAARQMRGFGGMLSFTLRGGREAALAVAGRLALFANATSLGGCESLVEHRRSIEGRQPRSPDNLLRLSVGLEHPDDLVADLAAALDALD